MHIRVARALLPVLLIVPLSAQKQPFNAQAMMQLARISDPQLSPDGHSVAFTVQTIDVASNTRPKQIYVVALDGGAPRKIADAAEHPRWSLDSRRIAFVSDRGGSSQIWLVDADGANAKQITNLATEAGGVLYARDGKSLVFTSEVYPDCGADDACNKQKLDAEKDNNKVKARTTNTLLYRHWTAWQGPRRSHLLVIPVAGGTAKDLTPGNRDVPPFSLGGPEDYAISPDGTEVCYAVNADEVPAISTNTDLYVVPIVGGPPKKITVNPAADNSPQYSPDGKYLAFRAQTRPGYESDRWRLMVLERATGKLTNLTETLDRWVESFAWWPDSSHLFFTVQDRGRQSIQFIAVMGGGARVALSGDSSLDDMQITPDGKMMIYTRQSGASPVEIFRAASDGGRETALTHVNDDVLNTHQLSPPEEFWVDGAENVRVQGFIVKPPDFQPNRKYPALILIHGGPQGHWGEEWSYRWNAQVFAAAGYVVAMPNPRGSTGYGQKFIDDINGDWGGRAYDDVMAATDYVSKLSYVDGNRMAAAGGSYGGYMVDWILGHTQRFKALISHAGVFDLRSEATETEELWFPIWEFGGMPWENPEMYQRWSPSHFVKEFRTPTLVFHGELDFRVPYGQGLQLFTGLQLQKVPSRLIVFPDEGHWVLKPQNSLFWYKNFIDWIDTWTKK
ncbi:MAG: S9 family peptidase [Acidobacteria bacterium]|nr:MAG: S9 family peptidase [Acidobacteriota bacterium]